MTDDRIQELEAQVARLTATVAKLERAQPEGPTLTDEVDRRHALRHLGTLAAGALAGGAALAVGTASPASAAAPVSGISATDDGVYGETSAAGKAGVNAVATTATAVGLTATNNGGGEALRVMGTGKQLAEFESTYSTNQNGFSIKSTAHGRSAALEAHAEDGWALFARSSGTGLGATVFVTNDNPNGVGVFVDAETNIQLVPSGDRPPARLTGHGAGSVVAPLIGPDFFATEMWFCTNAGTPGTWRKVAGPDTAGALHVLPAPVRVYDSRPGALPAGGTKAPLAANATRDVDCTVASAVPAGATTALVNVTATGTVASGWLALYAPSATYTGSSSLNWSTSGMTVANTTVCALSPAGLLRVRAGGGTTDFLVDVVGYYL